MTLSKFIRLIGTLSLVALLGACGDSDPDTTCSSASDCPEGFDCTAGACVAPDNSCEASSDCTFGNYCVAGECVDATCAGDDECTDAVCVNNRCREGCSSADDCGEGESCNMLTRLCEASGCTTGSCPQFQTCNTEASPSACEYTGDCNNDSVCIAYAQQLNDGNEYICSAAQQRCIVKPECGDDSDCAIGDICEPRASDGRRVCRRGCRDNDECGLSQICSAEQGYRCVAGCETSADCTGEGQACFNLECVDTCNTRSDCAGINVGYICTGSPRVCQACTDSSQCPASQFCDFTQGNSDDEAQNPSRGLCVNLPPTCPPDVYGNNDDIDNAFEVTTLPFEPADDDEPNFCKEKTNGDWYEFEAQAGDVIEVELNYATAGNLDVALRTVDGVEIASSARPPSEDNGTELIRYGTAVAGTFTVQVRGSIINDSAPYQIRISSTPAPACVADTFEPNNSIAEAAELAAETDVTAQVCGEDPDFYTLDVIDNQIVTIRAAAPARLGDIDLVLRDAAGDIVAQALTGQDVEQIQYVNDVAQVLTLEVRVSTNAGYVDYELEWFQRDNQCSDDFETNDTCGTANVLTAGTYTDLAVCADSDYYAVDLLPLQTVTFRAIYDPAVAAGDLDITLFGPNDCSTFITTETRETIPNSTQVAETITYTANVGGRFNILANLFAGINVPYALEVDIQDGPPCVDDSREPNNSGTEATVIPIADARLGTDNVITGLRVCDTDSDWFAIDLEEGDEIRWDITFDNAQGNLDAFIIAPDQTTVLAAGDSDADTESVTYTVATGEAGTYYLRVEGKDPARNTYWLLTYVNGTGPADPACPDPFENNDSAGDSSPIGTGSYGLLVCTGDDDWFEYDILAGETIQIDLTFPHNQGNIDLFLYGNRSTTSTVAESRSFSDNESVTYTSPRDQTLKWRVTTSTNNVQAPYTMDVTTTPAPGCVDDAFAPNGDSSSAPTIDVPGLYRALSFCEGTEDWFQVQLETEPFEAFLNFTHNVGNLDITVYDSTMTEVGTSTTTSDDESVQFTPAAAGAYFIRVFSPERARVSYDLMLYANGVGPADRVCPDEFENNDTFVTAKALPLGLTENLQLCNGNPTDPDYYSVFVPSGATLDVEVLFAHTNGDINARLYRQNSSSTVVNSSTSQTDNEELTATNSGTGENYIINIYGNGTFRSDYDLEVSLSFTGACPDDTVGAPALADATTAVGVEALDALYLCEGTEDWFQLPASTTELVINLEVNNLLGNVDMEVVDSSGTVVQTSAGDTNLEELSVTGLSSAETYYLRVFPRNGAFFRNEYDLWISANSVEPAIPYCPDPFERNDSISGAATLSNAVVNLIDTNACGPDIDWYAYNVTNANTDYRLRAFFDHVDTEADLAIEVRNAAGTVLMNASANSSTNDEALTFRPTATGTHFIGVSNDAGSTTEVPYYLHVSRDSTWSAAFSCPDDQYEPNNTPAQRATLTQGGVYAMASCPGANNTQDDYFLFRAPEAGTWNLTIMYEATDMTPIVQTIANGTFSDIAFVDNRHEASFVMNANDTVQIYLGNGGTEYGPYILKLEKE